MADVRPFRGLLYNPDTVGDLSNVICPPFDTIPMESRQALHDRGEYNVIRLESGHTFETDTVHDNRYIRSADLLEQWINNGVLLRDDDPTFYLIEHQYESGGVTRRRAELLGCVRLEDYKNRVILPHEYIRDFDRSDRLNLMKSCRSNFSPIMCLYRDDGDRLSAVFSNIMASPPEFNFSDAEDQVYRFWKITDVSQLEEIADALSSKQLYIADGHHRYDAALAFRDLHYDPGNRDRATNFVMMALICFDDPGLLVLPYHRVLFGLDTEQMREIFDRLSCLFAKQGFTHDGGVLLGRLVEEVANRGGRGLAMGMVSACGDEMSLMLQRDEIDFGEDALMGHSEPWVLSEKILRPVLGESMEKHVDYVHDHADVERRILSGECQVGFLMKPFQLELFEAIMDAGRLLPPKSTFFYPKMATGLVINSLDGML